MKNKTEGHSIKVVGATKNYGTLAALDNFSINVKPGKFTVLLGPSGSGKSTLIRSIAGIEKIDKGSIFLGKSEVNRGPINIAPERRDLAMVFQDYALWPHLTAFENVGYALKRRKIDSIEGAKRIQEMLERVGLGAKGKNYPHELSGGEQQRVALARAVVARPSLLLFDEPLSNLDADLRERLRVEIATLTRESGATALYITHDQSEAFALADEVGVLRSGKLEQFSTPEDIYQNPTSTFVARFTGLGGSFIGVAVGYAKGVATVQIGKDKITARSTVTIVKDTAVEILLRPTASSLKAATTTRTKNSLPGIVLDTAYRGRGYEHLVETEYGQISGIFDLRQWSRGSRCLVEIDQKSCLAFPAIPS